MVRPRLSVVQTSSGRPHSAPAEADNSQREPNTRRAFSGSELFPTLGKLASSVGQADFYQVALELVGRLVRCDRRLVMRYSRFDKPSFLVNQSLPDDFVASYLNGLYRFDPLYRVVRAQEPSGVLTFQDLREKQPVDSFYDEFFASVMIHDELSLMLPAFSGVCIALCFDRDRRAFQHAEVFRLHQLHALIDALHRLHLEKTMFGSRGGSPIDGKMAFAITDCEGRVLFSNERWRALEPILVAKDLGSLARGRPTGEHFLDADQVLHWETLPETNVVAPGGRIHIVERTSPGFPNVSLQVTFKEFAARYGLTPRESDIVWLMLRGYPSSKIATRLGVSAGTVKNHRYRLYTRLDITTEREIFSLFLNEILSHS